MKIWLLTVVMIAPALSAETKVKLEDLPAAVQHSLTEQTKTATIVGLTKEVEKGKTVYEVETKINGKTRDLLLDASGSVIETEDEVGVDSIPASAKAAILKRAGPGGTIQKVEKVTAGSNVSYEAAIRTRSGKSIEAGVNADGSFHKE
jgi:hypothetical protein